jgi:polyvinyl alcohol dehydrogenase (cytochrome)
MKFLRGFSRLAPAMLLPGFILTPLPALPQQEAEAIYSTFCAACHDAPDPQADAHTPSRADMALFTPNSVYAALNDGLMRLQAVALQDTDKRALAAWITGRELSDVQVAITTHLCSDNPPPDAGARLLWNGWGPDVYNTRFAAVGGINAADLPKLELAWAYGLPGEGQPRAQPAIADGRLYVGSRSGALYAIDANSGCTYWTFLPRAGIRSAISLAPYGLEDGSSTMAAYFVDVLATVYAVNAHSGVLLWQRKVEDHPSVRGTGALTLHDGRVYVPMSGVTEENTASNPDYSCCTFRGSLSALDAQTGAVIWKYYTVAEPQPRGSSSTGVPLFGPAGVGIWSAPTVDTRRGLIYAATGNAYAEPAPLTSDAVIAVDINTGELAWVNQLTPGDAWIGGCPPNNDNPNCPADIGPDLDFSASPVLTTTSDGRELIVVPQKSGMVYALDPDAEGALVWEYRAGPGSAVGGIWGAAVAGDITYVARGGYFSAETGGLHGIDTRTGQRRWFTPPADLLCTAGQGCGATQSAAVTAIPGAVFSGSQDGGLRAYAESSGEILWTFDANREFTTVNGVLANGGSFDGAGPVIANGMLYVLSGNAGFVGRPGNVLLAFKVRPE